MFPDTTSSMWVGYYQFQINITDPACPHTTGFHGSTLDEISQYSIMDETNKCVEETATNYTTRPGQRWWIWVSHDVIDYHRNISFTSPFLNTTYPAGQPSVSTIACEPTVQMRKALITTDGITYNATLTNDGPTPMKLNISAWDMQSSVTDSDALAGATFQGAPSGALHVPDDFSMSRSLYLLMNASDPRRTYQDWMDTNFLIDSARKAYQRVAVQVALEQYLTTANDTTHGTTTWVENRLVLRPLSFYLSVAILAVLIGIAALLCLYHPAGLVPHDPGSILGLASIVAPSSKLQHILEDTGRSAAATETKLSYSNQFQSGIAYNEDKSRFQIVSSGPSVSEAVTEPKQRWWQPFPFTLTGKIITLLSPVIGIVVLEVLYQTSHRDHGIADVPTDPYVHYTWVYLPALMVWAINTCFKNVYSNKTIVQPYYVLRYRSQEASHAMQSNFMSNSPLLNIWVGIRKRYITIILSAIAVLLGGILPVVVSGLYTPKIMAHTSTVQPVQQSWFNATQSFYAPMKIIPRPHPINPPQNRMPLADWILYNNFSYPKWTYSSYALSAIDFDKNALSSMNMSHSTIITNVPAVRGRTNCTIVRESDIHLPGFQALQAKWPGINSFGPPMPESCVKTDSTPYANDVQYYGRFMRAKDYLYNSSEITSEAENKTMPLAFVEF